MQTKTYILTKSMLLIITYAGEFPSFSKCHEYSQTVFDLDKTLLQKLKLITLDCYGDFEDLYEY